MIGLPILSLTIFLPLLGCLFLFMIRGDSYESNNNARWVAFVTSLATLFCAGLLYSGFDLSSSEFQFVNNYEWLSGMNISYHVGVDGISLLFILLTAFLIPVSILSSWNSIGHRVKEYMMMFLLLETMLIGMFSALDLVLFYLFFEAVLIPMFLIIGIWGGERRVYAAYKFFLYTLLGSVLMLVAIMVIYFEVRTTDITAILAYDFPVELQKWLWLAFFASFAVKVPMWPFHTWLPDAHVEAPTAGSVILAGILLKLGGYGFIRFSLPMFPDASQYFAPFIFSLSLIAVVYTSLVALVQEDMKKLIAYSSVAHMGFVTLGIFTLDLIGVQGAIFQMFSHGLISGALFLCVGVIYDREHTRLIARFGGLVHRMPVYAVFFMVFTLASVALPGTSGFVGELLVLIAAFKVSWYLALIAGTGMILGAAYMLWLYRRVVFGQIVHDSLRQIKDLSWVEVTVFVPLLVGVILFGVYPSPILNLTETASANIMISLEKKKSRGDEDSSYENEQEQE
ncbi:MAG: NADH-quinone oxidoreductase subunit M [Alphaproteobacteria bacterium]|nr:NADH-quinone oxidoreductase subunit M [Alphaproteobacteria bacterium]